MTTETPQRQQSGLDVSGPEQTVSRATHYFLGLCVLLLVSLLVWAHFGELDIVSMVDGEVIPSTKVKRVEHLEGGIVRDILVREGDKVVKDQELVILEKTIQGSSVSEVQVRIDSLTSEVARLKAEAEGLSEVVFPEGFEAVHPDVTGQSRKLFAVSQMRLASEIAGQQQEMEQLRQDIQKITVRLVSSRESLKLLQEELHISEELLKDQLTSQLKHLRLQREATSLQSKIGEDEVALVRGRAALNEGSEKLKKITHAFREKARDELRKSQRELDEFTERNRKYADSLQRTVMRSPVDGVVKSLNIMSPGEVVKAGETIMEIVPSSDRLVIEAHLPIQDIGYVAVGQEAVVKLASRDARRFGKLDGIVSSISPDTFTNDKGRTFYAVRLETDHDYFQGKGERYQLYPGMLVIAYIHTGKRTVLEYLFSPFLDSMSTAFHER